MAPAVVLKRNCGPNVTTSFCKPDTSYLNGFNDIGGRPDERRGTKGSFTPGVRIMAGGTARNVPLDADIDPGTVLYTYPNLRPDMSAEARTNVVGGRPTERLGSQGSFTRGVRSWRGGKPCDLPLDADIDPGTVLHTYPNLRPDVSAEARTNVVGGRPTERLGSQGSFTRGVRSWRGGEPRDVPAGREQLDHGIVLFPATAISDPMVQAVEDPIDGGDEESPRTFLDVDDSEEVDAEEVRCFELSTENPAVAVSVGEGSTFRRCGSDSKFPAGPDFMSGGFPAF